MGGDVAIRTIYEPVTPAQFSFMREKMGPTSLIMETRAMARKGDESDATLAELKAVGLFYPIYGKLEIVDSEGNPVTSPTQELLIRGTAEELDSGAKNWGALVEKELLERLDLKIGDNILLGKKTFYISGIIKKEPDRIGAMRFALAPRVMISDAVFRETGLAEAGSQVYYDHKIYMPHMETAEHLARMRKELAAAFPDAKWQVRDFLDASPTLRRMIERLSLFLTMIGLTALLIGGIGISQAVRSFLEGKLSSIATLKCLGAPARVVFRAYLFQILALTFLGIAAGAAVGALLPLLAAPFLTAKLSLGNHMGIYPRELFLSGIFGVLTVLTFSLWPLGRALRVRAADLFRDLVAPAGSRPDFNTLLGIVIAAEALACLVVFTSSNMRLALWFTGGALAAMIAFFIVAELIRRTARKIRPPQMPNLRLALANVHRPGNITAGVILSLGISLSVLTAVALVQHNFLQLVRENISPDTPAFFFLDIQPAQVEPFRALVEKHASARDLLLTPSLRGRIVKVNGKSAEEALINRDHEWVMNSDRGFTWTRDLPKASTMLEGSWWPADYQGPPLVSISTEVAAAFDIGVDDSISVFILGREIAARVANVREIDWGSFAMNFAVTFAPGALDKVPGSWMGTVIIAPGDESALQRDLAKNFPNVTSVRVKDALEAAQKIIRGMGQAVAASAALMIAAGSFVLAGGIAAGHRRRVYDAVILKVLGATRKRLLTGFMLEYGILGLITALVAAGIGTLAAWGLQVHIMDMKWGFSWAVLLAISILCLLITLLAGFSGTWRATSVKAAHMLRNQ